MLLHKLAPAAALSLLMLLSGCGRDEPEAKPVAAAPVETEAVPVAQLPAVAKPSLYRLTLTIRPKAERFSGHTEIDLTLATARRSLFLHGLDLHVTKAVLKTASGKIVGASYKQVAESGVARVIFDRKVAAGRATLIFDYDAPYNGSLSGLYKVVDRGDSYAFTQFEATDARRAFPSFDEPGLKARFAVTVLAPTGDKVVGNTPVTSQSPAGNGLTRTVFAPTLPLPTYLIALAVGPLDIVDGGTIPANGARKYPIHLQGVTAKGRGDLIRYQLAMTPKIVMALENYFSIAYPFAKLDVLAVPDFAAGAMENAAAITYRERLLLMTANAPLDQRRAGVVVQAHELAHQWFGDYVTPRWWDDIWLNESFANWAENKASQAVMPQWDYTRDTLGVGLRIMEMDELPSARVIHQPVHNEDDIDNAFDGITYDKGAAVLQMFEAYVGEENWRRGITAYLHRFALGNASAQDFIGTIAQTTGHPEIVGAFNSYIDQSGMPQIAAKLTCTPQGASVDVSQSFYAYIGRTPVQRSWQVPMCVAGVGGGKACETLAAPSGTIALGATCPAAFTPNPGGKGYYRYALDAKGWQALIAAAPKLAPADQLTLVHNARDALAAGQTNAATFFAAVSATAPSAQFDLLDDTRKMLADIRRTVLTPKEMPAYRAFVAKRFGPRLAAIGLVPSAKDTPAIAMARTHLAELMAEEARDPRVLAALSAAAAKYLDGKGKDMGGISPDLLQESLRAGVIAQGTPFAQRLKAAFTTMGDEDFRRSVIYALTGSEDPAFLQSFFALMLDTNATRTGELRYFVQFMADEPVAARELWGWTKANFAALEARVSRYGLGRLPEVLRRACSPEQRDDLVAFLGPKAKDLAGVPRTLALAQERIGRCIAFRDAKGEEVKTALLAAK